MRTVYVSKPLFQRFPSAAANKGIQSWLADARPGPLFCHARRGLLDLVINVGPIAGRERDGARSANTKNALAANNGRQDSDADRAGRLALLLLASRQDHRGNRQQLVQLTNKIASLHRCLHEDAVL